MRSRHLVAGLLALSCFVAAPCAQSPHHLVQVQVAGPQQTARLMQLDLDIASSTSPAPGQRVFDVIATDADLRVLRRSGLSYTVGIRNLEQHYAQNLATHGPFPDDLTPALGQGAMGGHYTLAQMEANLDSFSANYPALCAQKVSIGQSIENRDIWMVKISDNVQIDENEPEVLYTALHHAREPLSMEATLQFMDELLTGYGTDPEATFIVDNRELFFVTCLNPDGYEYNYQQNPGGGGMWRKNRRNNGDGTFGVDLNRNYSVGWNAPFGGNSTTTSSATYRGTAAFSEPETAAISAFANARTFVQVTDTHTYTDVLLRPWSYQSGDPANVADYVAVGDAMTASNGIAHGAGSTQLYIAAGASVDWHHVQHGSLAWIPELGRSNEGGFWPNPANTVAISRRHQPMFRALALTSGAHLEIDQITVTEAPGGNGNGTVEPGETGRIVVQVANNGLQATALPLNVALTARTTAVTIGSGQVSIPAPLKFSTVNNSSSPLTFTVPASFADPFYILDIGVMGNGQVLTRSLPVALVPPRTAVDDDMETDRGFARGATTASTGAWERGIPQQTISGSQTIQPGFQHTTGGSRCWITDPNAGSSAGTYDVDNGYTDLLTPVLNLSHLAVAELRVWRWYVDSSNDDAFEILVSYDGGQNWESVLNSSNGTTAWVEYIHQLSQAPTDSMQFRFRAQDNNASLVEAGIDDFAIAGVMADGGLTLLSSGAIGTEVRIGVNAPAGAMAYVMGSPSLGGTVTFPGVGGMLRIGQAGLALLPGVTVGSGGYAGQDLQIPNLPVLVGTTFYWQSVYQHAGQFAFGDNVQVLVLQ